MDSLTIRETFLDFYAQRGHRRYDSIPLIPNDPTLLLTIAGMVPFKSYMMGDAVPPSPRATSFQKCVRTNDIENVGRTARHLSLFEMLGNFSFGDYFKHEAIRWSWELTTQAYGFDPERVWVTIYTEDEESADIWEAETDVPRSRIQALGAKDNFWSMGTAGPCGPNTELYYDRGPAFGSEGGPAVDDERYLEFYNLVFMQYERDAAGAIVGDLPQQNVDTGMGMERMAVLLQDVPTIFETDGFRPIVRTAEQLTGHTYGADAEADVSLRILAEHARSTSMLIADGVLPAKDGRGYVLRRILRRLVRHTRTLGVDAPVLPDLVDAVIVHLGDRYPELERQRELITRVASAEERDFGRRLESGMALLTEAIDDRAAATGELTAHVIPPEDDPYDVTLPAAKVLPGDVAFKLHDTFGFPVELTVEIADDLGVTLDRGGFDALMTEQRERARANAKKAGGVPADVYREAAERAGQSTEFLGYDELATDTVLGALVTPSGLVEGASEGDELEVVLPRTPFYAEAGGQVGDRGTLTTPTGRLEVLDTVTGVEGVTTHRVRVLAGEVAPGQQLQAVVDAERRLATGRAHSATHVVHATLKEILGEHAQQAGSLNEPGRLRFDFPHFEALTPDELARAEELVNERVLHDPRVITQVMALEDARAAGAVANFGDKYGETVRVVSIGEFSKELCGGTHVGNAARIGAITITREESVGANTRRIEALVGLDAHRHLVRERMVAEQVARLVDAPTGQAVERVEALLARLKAAEKQLTQVRKANLSQVAADLAKGTERVEGLAVLTSVLDGADMDDLRQAAREARGVLGERAVVVLGTGAADGKAQLICAVSEDLVAAGVEARPILHPAAQLVGGGAGGRGDLAQAGGRDGAKLVEALALAASTARSAVAAAGAA